MLPDPFYALYKNAGFVPIEIATNGIVAAVCFVGICLNLSLVYVTIKTKSMHSPCNILIAMNAFFDCFMLFSYSVKFFVFLFGINYISLAKCYAILIVPLMGSGFAIGLQAGIAYDRLIGALFPFWYKFGGKLKNFKCIVAFCVLHTLLRTYIATTGAIPHFDNQVMCLYSDLINQPETQMFFQIVTLSLYVGETLCYICIWLIVWLGKTQISMKNKKLLFSLCIMMGMGVFCYIGNILIFRVIVPLLNLPIFTIEYAVLPITSVIYLAAYSSSTPILIICSAQYKDAFRKCFSKQGSAQQVQQPINMVNVRNANANIGSVVQPIY